MKLFADMKVRIGLSDEVQAELDMATGEQESKVIDKYADEIDELVGVYFRSIKETLERNGYKVEMED